MDTFLSSFVLGKKVVGVDFVRGSPQRPTHIQRLTFHDGSYLEFIANPRTKIKHDFDITPLFFPAPAAKHKGK